MSDLHLVSQNDELSIRNGSAILGVAKELQKAAQLAGKESWIGGGHGKLADLAGAVEVIEPRFSHKLVKAIAERLSAPSKFAFGVSLTSGRIRRPVVADVMNVYCHNQPWIASQARRAFPSAKIHLYVHNQILRGAPSWIVRKVLRDFDTVICVSSYISNELQSRAKFARNASRVPDFHTVFNGVDTDRFRVDPSSDPVDVVYVGRVVPDKGAHVLAAAMAELAKTRPCSLRIVGGASFLPGNKLTPYESAVFETLTVPGLDFVRTGPVPPASVPALINSSRVLVVPSVWDDPCPLTFLEGLASTACVVASKVGGMPEVGPHAGAIFVDPNDHLVLAETLSRLLDNRDLERSIAATGQSWVKKREWSTVYNELCAAVC